MNNLEDIWYKYRDRVLEKIGIEWCGENNISYQ